MSEKPGILVVGDVMTDIIARPDGPIVVGSDRRANIRSRPGGSGANQAVWLGALGARVRFAARVGAGDLALYENYFRGLNVAPWLTGDQDMPSGVLVTILDAGGERSFLTDRGANLNLSPADLPDTLLDGTDLMIVSGYSFFETAPRSAVLDLIARARGRDVAVVVDPASVGFLSEVGAPTFLEWTRGADLLIANREEAAMLSGSDDLNTQFVRLGEAFETVIVKRGAEGAAIGGQEGLRTQRPAPQVAVIDTTGAGDAFAAGFLLARLGGQDEDAALDAGIAAGAKAVGQLGGQPG